MSDDKLDEHTHAIAAELAPRLAALVLQHVQSERQLCRRCRMHTGAADPMLGLALRLLNASKELRALIVDPLGVGECVGDRSLRIGSELAQIEMVALELRDGGAP